MRLAGQQRDWEELADLDPYWAIASAPDKRFGGWGAEELMATGRAPIARLMRRAEELGRPEGRGAALDFGCGVGRLTRSLAEHFEECVGVDISDRMVAEARRLNADHPGCRFVVNATDDLSLFEEGSFDLIHTRLVLQHLPGVEVIGSYLREFVRVLRPGGLLAFQVPSSIARRNRLQPQRRLYSALRRAGAPPEFLYRRLRLQPIRMTSMPVAEVRAVLASSGARVLDVETERGRRGNESSTYYASR